MKNKTIFLAIICFTLIYQTPFSFGETVHFDSNGAVIDKIHYEIIVSEREKVLRLKLKNGYGSESTWRDPIKLRQRRIFQWRIMRPLNDSESLPKKLRAFQQSEICCNPSGKTYRVILSFKEN